MMHKVIFSVLILSGRLPVRNDANCLKSCQNLSKHPNPQLPTMEDAGDI